MNCYLKRIIRCLSSLRAAARHAESGQGLVEYAAILSFVAAVMVIAIVYLEPHIATALNSVANGFHQ